MVIFCRESYNLLLRRVVLRSERIIRLSIADNRNFISNSETMQHGKHMNIQFSAVAVKENILHFKE